MFWRAVSHPRSSPASYLLCQVTLSGVAVLLQWKTGHYILAGRILPFYVRVFCILFSWNFSVWCYVLPLEKTDVLGRHLLCAPGCVHAAALWPCCVQFFPFYSTGSCGSDLLVGLCQPLIFVRFSDVFERKKACVWRGCLFKPKRKHLVLLLSILVHFR